MPTKTRLFRNIAGAATTVVSPKAGRLHGIVINQAIATGVITIYDNTAASGTIIATITNPATLLETSADFDYFSLQFSIGLTIVTSSTDNITVIYS